MMTGEPDQTSIIVGDATVSGSNGVTGAKSEAASVSSSSNVAIRTMVKKEVPKLYKYQKASTTTEKDILTYHVTGWLPGLMLCSTTSSNFPTIDRTNIVCVESHLMCGLGLPPSKFLVPILNYLGCELVHLNLKAIAMLSYFSMLCECWLIISTDTSLF
jgi:hypothetical protein